MRRPIKGKGNYHRSAHQVFVQLSLADIPLFPMASSLSLIPFLPVVLPYHYHYLHYQYIYTVFNKDILNVFIWIVVNIIFSIYFISKYFFLIILSNDTSITSTIFTRSLYILWTFLHYYSTNCFPITDFVPILITPFTYPDLRFSTVIIHYFLS